MGRQPGTVGTGALTGAEVARKCAGKLGEDRALALVVAIGALVRLVDIGLQSYSMDELWEFAIVRLPVGEIVGLGDGFPPLFHLVFRALFLTGIGDFAGRMISAVFGIATVWLVGRLGYRINREVGLGAALATALAPLLVLLSKEARAYGIFIFLAALLLLVTWNVLDSPSLRSWTGFVAVTAFGMYTHYMFVLAVVSAELVILWAIRRSRERLISWVFAHGALVIALVPLVLIAIPDFETDAANAYSRTVDLGAIAYAGLSLFTGTTLGPSSRSLHTTSTVDALMGALPWILLIGVAAGYFFILGWKALSTDWRIRLGAPLVVPILLLAAISAVVGTAFRVRYLSWLVIPLAIWLAVGYTSGRGNIRKVAAGVLVVTALSAMVARDVIADYEVEDARSAAAYIEDHPDTPAVAMAWYMTKPIEYYLDLDSATHLPEDEGWGRFDYHDQPDNRIVPIPSPSSYATDMSEQIAVFDAAIEPGEEYLFIRSREFHADTDGEFFALRTEADGLELVAEYAGITIYRGIRGRSE